MALANSDRIQQPIGSARIGNVLRAVSEKDVPVNTVPVPVLGAGELRDLSDHHHRLPPQASRRPSDHGACGAHHDPVSGLHSFPDLLSTPGLQPCSRKCGTFHDFAKHLAYWFAAATSNT